MSLACDATTVEQIVQTVFSTMAQIDLVPGVDRDPSQDVVLATIQISGGWAGGIVLRIEPNLASETSAAMLQIPIDDVTEVDRCDVVAELVNMIGGNLKSVLPGPSTLSLPKVKSNACSGLFEHPSNPDEEVCLTCERGQMSVSIFQTTGMK